MDPAEQRPRALGCQGRKPVCAVYVQPQPLRCGDVCDPHEIVDDPGVRRPCSRDDCEHAPEVCFGDRLFQSFAGEASSFVGRYDEHQCVHDSCGRRDRRMRGVADDDHGAGRILRCDSLTGTPRVSSRHQRAEVRGRAARHEDPTRLGRQASEVGDPSEGLVLRERGARALQPRAGVDRRCADHEVEQNRSLGRRGGHEGQEPRVVDRDRRGRQHLSEDTQGLDPADAHGRDRLPGRGAQLVGRSGAVERRRIEPHPLERIVDDRPGDRLGALVEAVHCSRVSRSAR